MLISSMVLKFELTDKINQIQLCHYFESNKNMKHFSNAMMHGADLFHFLKNSCFLSSLLPFRGQRRIFSSTLHSISVTSFSRDFMHVFELREFSKDFLRFTKKFVFILSLDLHRNSLYPVCY